MTPPPNSKLEKTDQMLKRLTFIAKYYVATVLVFIVAKVVFMLCSREAASPLTLADMKDVVVHGLSLDLSTALYFLILPFLLSLVSVWWQGKVLQTVLRVYTGIVAVAFALAFVADTSLYAFWKFKLDATCLQYLDSPEGITQSVSAGYLLWRALLLTVVAAAIYCLLSRCRLQEDLRPVSRKRQVLETILYVVLMPLMVIGIRGGVTESTTNIGQVYYSQNQFLNHSAVNPVFSFLSSLGHQMGDVSQYSYFDEDECQRLVKDVYTTESTGIDTLLTTTRPNIVIILLESCGEEFATAMPRLQELKKEGISFSRCYGNSWRTDRGTVCALSGYPSFPSLSVMKMPGKSRTMPGIARTLRQQGYATTYLYGGDINFTNMRGYLVSTGWQTLVSMDDFSFEEQHSAQWGVRDDLTFDKLFGMIAGNADSREATERGNESGSEPDRFLIGYSTLSSHEPWDVPTKTLDDEVLNAFAYLDSCLYDFIGRLKKTPQWQDLLVVMTADHGINFHDIDQSKPMEKNHIPMLWVGGAVKEPREVGVLCNQSDLAATLLGQLRLAHDDFAFSRDVLSDCYRYPTVVHNYNNAQWIADSTGHILYDFNAQQFIVRQSRDADRLLRVNKAVLQATTNDLSNRR